MTKMLKIFECDTSYDKVGRIYHTKHGRFYSVTTMLGATGDKEFLVEWRKRIGNEEADKITRVAGHLGTDFHQQGEDWLLKKPLSKVQWLAMHLFNRTKPILAKHVTMVHAVEIPLFSKVLQLGGRTDAIVDWDDELAVLDFKCIGHLNPEWLVDYWIQASIYARMLKDMYQLEAKKLVLVCANKKTFKANSFECNPLKYSKEATERILKFRSILENN